MQPLVSAVIIARNEAHNLPRTLSQLMWCDEIILVDDFSTDNTKAVAEAHGCKVFQRSFDGYGTQKQFAVSQAANDWVLNIDADEVLSDMLVAEIPAVLQSAQYVGYNIPITHVFLGKVFKYGKESRYHHLRLFNKQAGNFDAAKVHEKVQIKGGVGVLKGNILHYSYRDLSHYFEKFNRYTDIGARKLFEAGKRRSLLGILVSFPFYFIKHYFLYGNICNGYAGFVWSYLNAWYHVVKYLKLRELRSHTE